MKKIYTLYFIFIIIVSSAFLYIININSSLLPDKNTNLKKNLFANALVLDVGDSYDYANLKLLDNNKVVKVRLDKTFVKDRYEAGDKVILYVTYDENHKIKYDIADYYHLDGFIFSFIILFLVLIFIAKKKGLMSILSVIISIVFFYVFVLLGIKIGIPIMFSVLIYVFIITFLTIPLIHGFNKKSLTAIISVNIGYLFGFILSYLLASFSHLGATPSEEYRMLFSQFPDLDLKQVVLASLFLGAVGALIDVSITISSAIFEGMHKHPNLNFKDVYKIGMNIGGDILGSMINTLLIAYLAASLPFLLLISLGGFKNLSEFLNFDFISLEFTRVFVGALSIVLLIPITSILTSYFVLRQEIIKD